MNRVDLNEIISSLSEDERDLLKLALSDDTILDLLVKSEYSVYPVPIEEFVDDEYYLGELAVSLYPELKKDLISIFKNNYYEIILTGAIGWGKTTLSRAIILRLLYELSCLKNPQRTFGLESNSYIYVGLMSLTEKLARPSLLEPLFNEMKTIRYFVDNIKFDLKRNEIVLYDKNIKIIPSGINNMSVLGLNLMYCVIDEANFLKDTTNKKLDFRSNIHIIYDSIVRRIKSRFIFNNKYYGKLLLVSSAADDDSFVEKHIESVINDSNVYICRHSVWDAKPSGTFSDETFAIVYSKKEKNFTPKIFKKSDFVELEKYKNDDKFEILYCPVDFYDDFERDIFGSLRDIAGVSIVYTDRFIPDMSIVRNCIDYRRHHPMDTKIYVVDSRSKFNPNIKFNLLTDNGKPIVNSNKLRFAHIDLGIKHDATGISIGHISHYVYRRKRGIVECLPFFYIDFILKIVPDKGSSIVINDIKELFYKFKNAGFLFGCISMDSFQGIGLSQSLESAGFRTKILSVDKEPFAYELLKSVFEDRRISLYNYDPLMDELSKLIVRIKGKSIMIDHPKYGSKDVADSLSGLIYMLSTEYRVSVPLLQQDNNKLLPNYIDYNGERISLEEAMLLGIVKNEKSDNILSDFVKVEFVDDGDNKNNNDDNKFLFNELPFLRG